MSIYNLIVEPTLLLSFLAFVLGFNTLKSDLNNKISLKWYFIRFFVLIVAEYFILFFVNNSFFRYSQLFIGLPLLLAVEYIYVPVQFKSKNFGLHLSLNNILFLFVLLVLFNKSDKSFLYNLFDVVVGLGIGFLVGELILWVNIRQPFKHPLINTFFFGLASLILIYLQKGIYFNIISAMYMLGFIMGNSMFGLSQRKQTKSLVNILFYAVSLLILITTFNKVTFNEIDFLILILIGILTSISSVAINLLIFLLTKKKIREMYMGSLFLVFPFMSFIIITLYPDQNQIIFFYLIYSVIFVVFSKILNVIMVSRFKRNIKEAPKKSVLFENYKTGKYNYLPDFSYAGYKYNKKNDYENEFPIYNIADYNIKPDTGKDLTHQIQIFIDKIGEKGGGIIYFPSGKYCFNANRRKIKYISINHSNICIRGDEKGKTIFFSKYHSAQFNIVPWNSPALITTGTNIQDTKKFWGLSSLNPIRKKSVSSTIVYPDQDLDLYEPEIITKITSDHSKGANTLKIESTANIKKDDVILIAMYNTSDDGNLIKKLLNRSKFTKNQIAANSAGIEKAPSFQWMVEVKNIIDCNTIELYQPIRIAIETKFDPVIARAPMLRNICIENIHFKSGWDGLFKHHGFPVYYSNKAIQIMDYGFNAVKFCRVAHGYIRNVKIEDFSNPLCLEDSRNITAENIDITGHDGHRGIQVCCHSCDNLIRKINFSANYADMIGGDGNAYGNVFSDVKYWHYDNKYADIDFHGFGIDSFSPPAWNLFENFDGLQRIRGNGPEKRFPNCGINNVFWNINSHGFNDSTEVFIYNPLLKQTLIVRYIRDIVFFLINTLKKRKIDLSTFPEFDLSLYKSGETHHSMYPDSIVSGYFSNDAKLTINGTDGYNQENITVEALNSFVSPKSLYEAQIKFHEQK